MVIKNRIRSCCCRQRYRTRCNMEIPIYGRDERGSVFLLLFIICTIAIGLPILLAEFVIGRMGQADAITSLKRLAPGKKWPFDWLDGTCSFIHSPVILQCGRRLDSFLFNTSIFFKLDATNHGDFSIRSSPIQ